MINIADWDSKLANGRVLRIRQYGDLFKIYADDPVLVFETDSLGKAVNAYITIIAWCGDDSE